MKVVLLAGGFGSRLAEETVIRPKPLVEIGGIPIIEHIMNWYMSYGYNDFVVCLGYKGSDIIAYFKDYYIKNSSCVISENGKIETFNNNYKPWKITLVQTGVKTQTAGRLKKIKPFLKEDESFMMTYGDGLSNVNINKLILHHKKNKKLATVTAVRPLARFGAIDIQNNLVKNFTEKPKSESGWINGGYFVLSKKALDFIKSDNEPWEAGPLPKIAKKGELTAFKHDGFWQPMDTLREKQMLSKLWETKKAPWIVSENKIKNVLPLSNYKYSNAR
tara:strand:+ start:458 stop:1282 length:825 start_codon:yes stop_codon:yes gene_type:complete